MFGLHPPDNDSKTANTRETELEASCEINKTLKKNIEIKAELRINNQKGCLYKYYLKTSLEKEATFWIKIVKE